VVVLDPAHELELPEQGLPAFLGDGITRVEDLDQPPG
jgi:hypothetical protein